MKGNSSFQIEKRLLTPNLSTILFKAINRKNISCKRYSLSFSGSHQTYRCKQNAVIHCSYRIFRDVSSRTVVFSVYRLALDAKPDRVML